MTKCGQNYTRLRTNHIIFTHTDSATNKGVIMDYIKPLSKSELNDAIDKFNESAREYTAPAPRGIAHTFYSEENFIEVSFPYMCEKCKRLCYDRKSIFKTNLYEASDYQKFQTIAAKYRNAGYDTHVCFYCDDCLAEKEYPYRVSFSFKTEDMTDPIVSNEILTGFTKQYELALKFLLGKRTVRELAEEDRNSEADVPWTAKDYTAAITKILRTGIDESELIYLEYFRRPQHET